MTINNELIEKEKLCVKGFLKNAFPLLGIIPDSFKEDAVAVMNHWYSSLDENPVIKLTWDCSIFCSMEKTPVSVYNMLTATKSLMDDGRNSTPSCFNIKHVTNRYYSNLPQGPSLEIFSIYTNNFQQEILDKFDQKFYYRFHDDKLIFNYKSYKNIFSFEE